MSDQTAQEPTSGPAAPTPSAGTGVRPVIQS